LSAEGGIEYRASLVRRSFSEGGSIKYPVSPIRRHPADSPLTDSPITGCFSAVEALASVGKYLSAAFGSHPSPKTTQPCPLDFALTMILHSISTQKDKNYLSLFLSAEGGTIFQIRHRRTEH
jgi:hypothetical protein